MFHKYSMYIGDLTNDGAANEIVKYSAKVFNMYFNINIKELRNMAYKIFRRSKYTKLSSKLDSFICLQKSEK